MQMGPCDHCRHAQEALKTIPDHVLDAPPPQLDALPTFSLPEPLPPPHSALAHAGGGVSSLNAALLPKSVADPAGASEEHSREQQQAALLGTSQAIADIREATAASRQPEHAAAVSMSGSGGEGTAEAKRLRLDSCAAGDVPGAGAAEDHSGVALDPHHIEGQSTLEQGLQHAQEEGIDAAMALEQHPEQTGKHRPYLEKGRVLVSA